MSDPEPPFTDPPPTTPPAPSIPPPPRQSSPSAYPADWYPDTTPGQLRYWDGQSWTEHVAPDPDGSHGPALPRINAWLSESFRLVIDRAGHLFTLIVLIALPFDLLASGANWLALQDVVVVFGDDDTISASGFNGWLGPALVAAIVGTVAKFFLAALSARHVLAARTGVPESWGETLRAGIQRLPRVIGSAALFLLCSIGVLFVALIPLSIVTALVPPLGLLGAVGLIFVLLVWLARVGLAPLMAIIAPLGAGGIRRSLALTTGRTGSLVARISMLALISFTMSLIVSFVTVPASGTTPIDPDADTLAVVDLIGTEPIGYLVTQLLTSIGLGAALVLMAGAWGLTYAQLGGAIEPSIVDVVGPDEVDSP